MFECSWTNSKFNFQRGIYKTTYSGLLDDGVKGLRFAPDVAHSEPNLANRTVSSAAKDVRIQAGTSGYVLLSQFHSFKFIALPKVLTLLLIRD
jgi:hypothetical protein